MGPSANAGGLSRKHIMEAIDHSLKRLGTDYVDLYQIHRFDPHTPMEETLEALERRRARRQGALCRRLVDVRLAVREDDRDRARKGRAEFVSMQNYYNLVYREEEREMMTFCADEGIAVIPWSPMARGYLAGSGVGANAATVRGRTDPFSVTLGLGSAQDEEIRAARGGGRARSRHASPRWWRSPGCCRSPMSPRRSSAPRSRTTSTTRWRRWR